ncbi:RNA polymerase sigma factor [Streptomyces sp. NPDC059637]|uniref:RNA polymerase sigma factor n=1 Tax=Streptomyces sp. NPDC059637 TaxID=3347752 RepID=UPI0036B2F52F
MCNTMDTGPGRAFDEAFCALLARLYRRAAALTGHRGTAGDIVHDAYLKLAARPDRLLAHPEPCAYAFSALLSVARDTWRRESRLEPADASAPGPGGRRFPPTHGNEPAHGPGGSWDGGVEQRIAELETLRLLGGLTARQAAVVILVDLYGYTIDQAAGILSVHRGTAARSRARALDRLRTALAPGSADPAAPGSAPAASARRVPPQRTPGGAGRRSRGGRDRAGSERRDQ